MAPIRVGIVGLSSKSSWATTAHLPYLGSSTRYIIAGVCNSSLRSSQEAIEAHSLTATAKAYESIAALAAAPDIDLVVCSVRVDRHYECLKPALAAGKNCFVEWPLASNLAQAAELRDLAAEKGVRTMVGLQGQMSPVVHKIKEMIEEENKLGKILSSSLILAGTIAGKAAREGVEYLDDAETGGNLLTIPLGHLYDSIGLVVGELQSLSATTSIQHHNIDVMDSKGKPFKTVQRTSADQISFSGLLQSGAQSTVTTYGGPPFPGEPHLIWRIEGEKGVLDVRGDSTFAISMSGNVKIRLQDYESGEVKDIEHGQEPTGPVGNVGRLYEAYADGKDVPDWNHAVRRHAWVDAVHRSSKSGRREAYL